MEIILGIFIIVIGIIVVNRINNNKPLSAWSDDKLKLTHDKSMVVANALTKRGKPNRAQDYVVRANELKAEMDRRNIS